jgi:hypothetical protein
MWVATTNFATAASHPFYTRLNQRLAEHYFDDFVEGQCQLFYAEIMGRAEAAFECRQIHSPQISDRLYLKVLQLFFGDLAYSGQTIHRQRQ